MKITIYELLGLIKEGKAPKKIEVDGYILELIEDTTNWKTMYIDEDKDYLFVDYHITLNDEIEVIEEIIEKKEIEKLNLDTDELRGKEIVRSIDYLLEGKINQLIDVINDMRDKE